MAGAEDVDEPPGQDRPREPLRRRPDGRELRRFDRVERPPRRGQILRQGIAAHPWTPSLTDQPPSTARTIPVMNLEAGSERKRAASAQSSAVPGPAAIGCLAAR